MKNKPKRDLFKSLQAVNLGEELGREIGAIDFRDDLGRIPSASRENLFLKKYNEDDILVIMDKVGLSEHLKGKGLRDLHVKISKDEALINYLAVYNGEITPDNLLVDLRMSESRFVPSKNIHRKSRDVVTYDMGVIEWFSSQNPKNNFSPERPQLPGQVKPGLGILNHFLDILYIIAKDVKKDGFLDVPDHIHGAIMYSRKFKFFDPVQEGILRALMRDLKDYRLPDVSWGILTKTIIDIGKNEPMVYEPSEQIYVVSERLNKHFESNRYKTLFEKSFSETRFKLDFDAMKPKREEILKQKNIMDL